LNDCSDLPHIREKGLSALMENVGSPMTPHDMVDAVKTAIPKGFKIGYL